jgi:hypothetical protein
LKHACPIIFFYFYVLFTLLPGRIDFHQDVHLVDAQARRYSQIESWSQKIRRCLSAIEAPVLAPDDCAMPAVVTIPFSKRYHSERVGDALKKRGVLISYRSDYLLARNWIQACMMGAEHKPPERFVRLLRQELANGS